jgi:hypothetical protein
MSMWTKMGYIQYLCPVCQIADMWTMLDSNAESIDIASFHTMPMMS